jgi:DNA polymerase
VSATTGTALRWVYQGYAAEPALAGLDRGVLVLGEGPPDPLVIFVGEAPGRTEAEEGRPFTGRAGRLLDGMLLDAGLDRDACWVTNVCKYRPVGPDGKDRPPSEAEVLASMPYLWRELSLVISQCKVICALGRTAATALAGKPLSVTTARGSWRVITDPAGPRYALFITCHPAAALRSRLMEQALSRDLAALHSQVGLFGARAAAVFA